MKKSWKTRLIDAIDFAVMVMLLIFCAIGAFLAFALVASLLFGIEALTNLVIWLIAILSVRVVFAMLEFLRGGELITMANEKRLINVNPFMKDGWHLVKTGKSNGFIASMSLADAPTVDAVEVVRCRDCIHAVEIEKDYIGALFIDGTKQCELGRGDPFFGYSIITNDGFCDSGERKEDGN